MAGLSLGLMFLYLALAFGVRVAVQLRNTGSTGISSLSRAPAIELLGGGMFLSAILVGGANPALVLTGVVYPIDGLDVAPIHVAGLALCALGIGGTFVAQMQMGASWRIGVDAEERTELVTAGVFSLVRNPIYTAMFAAWIGFALLVPTWVSLLAVPLVLVGLELQVRLVEEPHLLRTHGRDYRAYAARVGRFVPGIGVLGR
jgi:protein-S-isoprenylcysteine O-methyltransferase Ste14